VKKTLGLEIHLDKLKENVKSFLIQNVWKTIKKE
jgi:hypothetical protein